MTTVISDKLYDREATYRVDSLPSAGPFEVPFPFHDPDTVAVYLNGERTIDYQLIDVGTGDETVWAVQLLTAVTDTEVRILSRTGLTRNLDPVFEQAELSREIDRIFAIFQEMSRVLTGADFVTDGTNMDLVNEVFAKYDRLATLLADLLDDLRALQDTSATTWAEIEEAYDLHDDAIKSNQEAVDRLRDEVIANAQEAIRFTQERAAALQLYANELAEDLRAWVATVQPQQLDIADRVDDLAAIVTGAMQRLFSLEGNVAEAGIVVDEETGSVEIRGLNRVETQLGARLGEAELRVGAAEAAITQRATYSEVNDAIAAAQLPEVTLGSLEDLQLRTSNVELRVDAAEGAITAKADTVEVEGLTSRMTTAEADIDSLEGQISLKVDTTTFDTLETRVSTAEVTLSTIDGAAITQAVADTRQSAEELDLAAMTSLVDLWNAYKGRKALREATAFGASELRAHVDESLAAEAVQRQALGATVEAAAAQIASEERARADADSALASRVDDLETTLQDPATGLDATATALQTLSSEVTTLDGTVASQAASITLLEAAVDDPETGLAALSTAQDSVEALVETQGDTIDAHAIRLTDLETAVTDPATGLTATASGLSSLTTRVSTAENGITALATDLSNLTAEVEAVNGTGTALSALETRVEDVEGEAAALSSDLVQLRGRIEDNEADITNLAAVKVDAAGALAAVESQINASFGSLSGMAAQLLAVKADMTGVKSTYALRLNGEGVLEAVSLLDPNGAPVQTTIKLDADLVRVTGDLVVDGSIITRNMANRAVTGFSQATGYLRGADKLETLMRATMYLDSWDDDVEVEWTWSLKQGYSDGRRDWKYRLICNTHTLDERDWMYFGTDQPSGTILVPRSFLHIPGNNGFRFLWGGEGGKISTRGYQAIKAYKK